MYGKLLAISECGKYVVISSANHVPGVPRTTHYSSPQGALNYVLTEGLSYSSRAEKGHFICVDTAKMLNEMPGLFSYLLKAYEEMQQKDDFSIITNKGALIVAKMAWEEAIKRKKNNQIHLARVDQESVSNAVAALYNSDID